MKRWKINDIGDWDQVLVTLVYQQGQLTDQPTNLQTNKQTNAPRTLWFGGLGSVCRPIWIISYVSQVYIVLNTITRIPRFTSQDANFVFIMHKSSIHSRPYSQVSFQQNHILPLQSKCNEHLDPVIGWTNSIGMSYFRHFRSNTPHSAYFVGVCG